MHYVMSDIHGEIERYRAMLQKINFTKDDTLFILGDMIDRHPSGIDIIKDIMKKPNIEALIGNHEQMMLDDLVYNKFQARQLWTYNGGSSTRHEMLYLINKEERKEILNFVKSLPEDKTVVINNKKFYLVHGWPGSSRDDKLWNRPSINSIPNIDKDTTVIVGHTPVYYFGQTNEIMHIAHLRGFIGIDCGCGNTTPNRRLACLRLEDMSEFYT